MSSLAHVPEKGKYFNALAAGGGVEVEHFGSHGRQAIRSLSELGLCEQLLRNLKDFEVDEPTVVQLNILRPLVEHKADIWCQAPTGTGKTFAYIVAMLHRLSQPSDSLADAMGGLRLLNEGASMWRPRVLVIQPTREQAKQTFDIFHRLSQGLGVVCGYSIGGMPVDKLQQESWRQKLDVLITTPGRVTRNLDPAWEGPAEPSSRALVGGFVRPRRPAKLRLDYTATDFAWATERLDFVLLDDGDKLFHKDFQDLIRVLAELRPLRPSMAAAVLSASFPAKVQRDFVSKFLQPGYTALNVPLVGGTKVIDPKSAKIPNYASFNRFITQDFVLPQSLTAASAGPDAGAWFKAGEKDRLLLDILLDELKAPKGWTEDQNGRRTNDKSPLSIIVFMETVGNVRRLSSALSRFRHQVAETLQVHLPEDMEPFVCLHRDLPQETRDENIQAFLTKRTPILFCTSVAARGIDVPHVDLVLNYDLPIQWYETQRNRAALADYSPKLLREDPVVQRTIAVYVQRIGRTGRVGNSGRAISFFDPKWDTGLIPSLVIDILAPLQLEVPDWMTNWLEKRENKTSKINGLGSDWD